MPIQPKPALRKRITYMSADTTKTRHAKPSRKVAQPMRAFGASRKAFEYAPRISPNGTRSSTKNSQSLFCASLAGFENNNARFFVHPSFIFGQLLYIRVRT